MLDFRLKSYRKWQNMKMPAWANISEIKPINYDGITYYSIPKKKSN